MHSSVLLASLLGAIALAAPAPAGEVAVKARDNSLVARSNYVECHQNCVRGCPGAWICQATCNVACANAAEGDHEAAALAAREAVVAATKSVAAREPASPAPAPAPLVVARSNYIECHQNCVRGCASPVWICQATCNIACANAVEGDHEAAALATREAVVEATKSVAAREPASQAPAPLVARSNYVECHQNCVRGCPGAWICQATCNVACANAGEADHETAALTARHAVAAATKSVAVREEGRIVARSNYVECHQNCVRGCPGAWICQATCNVACANAGEIEGGASLAAREVEEQ